MKIRIKGNTLRMRISQTEYRSLVDEQSIQDQINFGSGALIYMIEWNDETVAGVDMRNHIIRVKLEAAQIKEWEEKDLVGIDFKSGDLSVLIEKDFQCLKPRPDENEEDLYPNPLVE